MCVTLCNGDLPFCRKASEPVSNRTEQQPTEILMEEFARVQKQLDVARHAAARLRSLVTLLHPSITPLFSTPSYSSPSPSASTPNLQCMSPPDEGRSLLIDVNSGFPKASFSSKQSTPAGAFCQTRLPTEYGEKESSQSMLATGVVSYAATEASREDTGSRRAATSAVADTCRSSPDASIQVLALLHYMRGQWHCEGEHRRVLQLGSHACEMSPYPSHRHTHCLSECKTVCTGKAQQCRGQQRRERK